MTFRLLIFFVVAAISSSCGSSSGEKEDAELVSLGLSPHNIEVDPFGSAPLSARLRFTAPEEGSLTVSVKGKGENGIAITHEHAEVIKDVVDHPVLGLYANHVNTVVVTLEGVSGQVYRDEMPVATQQLPAEPVIEILQQHTSAHEQMVYMFSRQKFAFDAQGEIRWAYLGNSLDIFRKLPDGRMLTSISENLIGYHSPKFAQLSMIGELTNEFIVDNYMHHEVRQLPWGNFLVAGNSSLIDFDTNGVPEEDVLLELDVMTGEVVKTWDFNQILDPTRSPIPSNTRPDDWLHLNSAVYDPIDNSIYITSQRQSLAAKIDYETGALIWILGAHELWDSSLQSKLLTPVDSLGKPVDTNAVDFWPYGPHAMLPLQNGALRLYDNGSYRGWYKDNFAPSDSYSRAVEYLVDEETMTVRITWEYSADKQIFTPSTGDIDMLDSGAGYLVAFAGRSLDESTPRIVELDESNQIIFSAVSQRGTQQYRAEKFGLYDGL